MTPIETLMSSLPVKSPAPASDEPLLRAIEVLDFLHNLTVTDRPDLPFGPETCWRTDTTAAREGLEKLLSGNSSSAEQ